MKIAVRLHQLKRDDVHWLAILFLFVYALHEFMMGCVALTVGVSPVLSIAGFIFLGSVTIFLAYKRRRAQIIAAKLLADDLKQYNEQWADVSQSGSHPAVARLKKAVRCLDASRLPSCAVTSTRIEPKVEEGN